MVSPPLNFKNFQNNNNKSAITFKILILVLSFMQFELICYQLFAIKFETIVSIYF